MLMVFWMFIVYDGIHFVFLLFWHITYKLCGMSSALFTYVFFSHTFFCLFELVTLCAVLSPVTVSFVFHSKFKIHSYRICTDTTTQILDYVCYVHIYTFTYSILWNGSCIFHKKQTFCFARGSIWLNIPLAK